MATPSLPPTRRRRVWLRHTLALSRREAVASALMTSACDNFLNAFAIYLRASVTQIGWLTALPQLAGALVQLFSVWIGGHHSRQRLIVAAAFFQSLVLAGLAALAASRTPDAVDMLIALAVCYHAALNLIQPHWRAWMGSVVPPRRRGAFFAGRTRLTMLTSLLVFLCGGTMLSLSESFDVAWLGFCVLFLLAFAGRAASTRYLANMHDPEPHLSSQQPLAFRTTLTAFAESLRDRGFRQYSLFLAGMQGVVALSAPFFAVYMLRDLHFSYLEFSVNTVASIAVQFATLAQWGRISDRLGHHVVMLSTAVMIPFLPILWLFSSNYFYLLAVQAISGLAWGGFSLSTANYLYDLRPHKSNFATYAAVQSGLSAVLVFCGAAVGGYVASAMPDILAWLSLGSSLRSPLLAVFLVSAVCRLGIVLWFLPRAAEPNARKRPQLLELVFRVARFNAISGVTLDWLTVARKETQRPRKKSGASDQED